MFSWFTVIIWNKNIEGKTGLKTKQKCVFKRKSARTKNWFDSEI